ncbi:MAG: amidohydrolase, partial [Verrucomicrobia bacterium]|nr:amidohydrolase [Verrucomicrobiota bacterium]
MLSCSEVSGFRWVGSWLVLVTVALARFDGGCAEKPEPASLVVTNGKIVTLDPAKPEAQALAARGDRIVAVGRAKEIARYIGGATEVIDLRGKLVTPGWIDSHLHFTGVGQARLSLDLTKARNWDEIVAMVAKAVKSAKPGTPITGRGWHQEKWDRVPEPNVQGLPIHTELSKVSPVNPVVLTHASGHSCLANAKAMEMAKITSHTPNPAGGEIIKDANGQPIGAFLETAQGKLRAALAQAAAARTAGEKQAEQMRVVELANQECLSKGLTSVHDAGVGTDTIALYKKAIAAGRLQVRIYAMLNAGNKQLAEKASELKLNGYGGNHLTVRSIKRFMDGALGSHGAWLLEPYADLPSSAGLNTAAIADLRETARIAIENGFQLCVHAIGDRGNRETLNIFEEAFKSHPEVKEARWRIEHAQHLSAADIPR